MDQLRGVDSHREVVVFRGHFLCGCTVAQLSSKLQDLPRYIANHGELEDQELEQKL